MDRFFGIFGYFGIIWECVLHDSGNVGDGEVSVLKEGNEVHGMVICRCGAKLRDKEIDDGEGQIERLDTENNVSQMNREKAIDQAKRYQCKCSSEGTDSPYRITHEDSRNILTLRF